VSFRCPTCRDPLAQETEHLVCRRCERHYPLVRGIPDFRTESGYWCNVSRQVLRELVDDARTSGDWRAAANRHVPDYVEHFTSRGRADFRFLLPLDRTSVVLDAGAMWGGITVPMAPEAGTVYAVDKTLETIEFLDLRAKQSGLGNVRVCACGLDKLPFQDGFFDIVILSGVLEWVAVDEETVLARDYFQPRHDRRSYGLAPERVQTDVLTELRRVLKATGVLCLAIENRYGLPYFLGKPDDHVNVRFVPLLPRRLANLVTQWRLNSPYRTYTHSDRALRSMLGEAGFDTVKVMGCSPHYIEPDFICNQVRARYYLRKHRHRLGRKYGLMSRLLPASLLSKTIPSFVVLAGGANGTQTEQAKLARVFDDAMAHKAVGPVRELALVDSRKGDDLPACFEVWTADGSVPSHFCKVARDPGAAAILKDECENMGRFHAACREPFGAVVPPQALVERDDVRMLIYRHLGGKVSTPKALYRGFLATRRLEHAALRAIELLCEFQRQTFQRKVRMRDLLTALDGWLARIGVLDAASAANVAHLREELERLGDRELPVCAVHGDFNLGNIMVCGKERYLLDFEHYEDTGLPFFDLGNITISTLLMAFDARVFLGQEHHRRAVALFRSWVSAYQKLSGIDTEVLRFLCPLAALEQKAKTYPAHRDPATYPMFPDPVFTKLLAPRESFWQ